MGIIPERVQVLRPLRLRFQPINLMGVCHTPLHINLEVSKNLSDEDKELVMN